MTRSEWNGDAGRGEAAALTAERLARLLDRGASPRDSSGDGDVLLRALVGASPLAVWVLDRAGAVLLWNASAERITGWREEEVLGRPLPTVPDDGAEEHAALFARVLRGESLVNVEVSRRRRDGEPLELAISAAPLVAPDGEVIAVLGMAADVTARNVSIEAAMRGAERLAAERATREALEASEQRFRSLVEATAQVVWRTDAGGRIVSPVPSWTALTGQSTEQARGFGTLDAVHPEHRDGVGRLWLEAVAARRPFVATFLLRVADGSYRWFAARGVPVRTADGVVREWIGTSSDIHDRMAAEVELRAQAARTAALARVSRAFAESSLDLPRLLDTVVRAVAETVGDSCVLSLVSDDGARLDRVALYHPDPAALAAMHAAFAAAPQRPDEGYQGRVLASGAPLRLTFDTPAAFAAGTKPEYRAHARALALTAVLIVPLRRAGAVVGTLTATRAGIPGGTPGAAAARPPYTAADEVLLVDIAERAGLAIEAARLYKAAVAASAAKSDFLAVMSHELRTPLSAILGYEELLADQITGPVNPAQLQQLRRIRASAMHLLGLIDEVLTFSRLEAGREEVRWEPVDVAAVVEESCELALPLAQAKRIELEVHPPRPTFATLSDPQKLRQVLLNLLSNAVKFTDAGGRVTVRARADGPDALLLEVADTGIGIPADQHERIFEPFTQVEQGATRRAGGTGLGLSVTRRLTRLLGGDVSVESAPGRGSVFRVCLPRESVGS